MDVVRLALKPEERYLYAYKRNGEWREVVAVREMFRRQATLTVQIQDPETIDRLEKAAIAASTQE